MARTEQHKMGCAVFDTGTCDCGNTKVTLTLTTAQFDLMLDCVDWEMSKMLTPDRHQLVCDLYEAMGVELTSDVTQ